MGDCLPCATMGRWHVGIPHLTRATWMAVALLCASPPAWGTEFAGQVVGITDGDTLTVLHDGVAQRIRLNGIDCPETAQAYGRQAKDAASALLYGQLVTVHPPRGQDIPSSIREKEGQPAMSTRLTLTIAKKYLQGDTGDLEKFTSIDAAAAQALAQCKGRLDLPGLTSLSDAAAQALAQYEGDLSLLDLDGLTSLSAAAAQALAKRKGGDLYLEGEVERKVDRYRS